MGVSGIKNKMGVRVLHFYSNSSYPKELTLNNTKSDKSVTKNFILSNISEDFLFWFSGFTDGEGNFLITLDRDYVKFRFVHKKPFVCRATQFFTNRQHTTRHYSTTRLYSTTRHYSTLSSNLNPHWVSGFVDAEGCFMITVRRQAGSTGWGVSASFTLHVKDLPLLYAIQKFFGVGRVHATANGGSACFTVSRIKDIISVIIPHFNLYPLQSSKSIDFLLWTRRFINK